MLKFSISYFLLNCAITLFLFSPNLHNKSSVFDNHSEFIKHTATLNSTLQNIKPSVDSNNILGGSILDSYRRKNELIERNTFLHKGELFIKDTDFLKMIYEKAIRYNVDPYLVLAIIKRESNFNPTSEYNGAYGLMQITKFAYLEYVSIIQQKDYSISEPIVTQKIGFFDIGFNTEIGIFYFSDKLKKYRNIHQALMAYNGGDKYAKNLLRKNISTTAYSREILKYAEMLRTGITIIGSK
jgi:hypothetical protein